MALWTRILEPFSVPAVRYAFDNWNRNGRFFPKPKDIIEQVEAWRIGTKQTFTYCGNCNEGWLKVYEGTTDAGYPVDPKFGAMKRCECSIGRKPGARAKIVYEHYGRGYTEADLQALWKIFREKYATPLGRPLTEKERADLIDELDRRRRTKVA